MCKCIKKLFTDEPVNKHVPTEPIKKKPVKDVIIQPETGNELFQFGKGEYSKLLMDAHITKSPATVERVARGIDKHKRTYMKIADQVDMPWWTVGLLHYMESGQSFKKHMHNGDSLKRRTVRHPAGRPKTGKPPFTFVESAIDAFHNRKTPKHWDIDNAFDYIERYNGMGYRREDVNIPSPYLWSYTNHYTKGKYVEYKSAKALSLANKYPDRFPKYFRDRAARYKAAGRAYTPMFDWSVTSKQVGTSAILIAMAEMGVQLPGITGNFEGAKDVLIGKSKLWDVYQTARKEIGVKEIRGKKAHPRIIEYHKTTGKFSSDEIAWCASFANWCMIQNGIKGTNSAAARSFMRFGIPTEHPKEGDVVVFWRGSKDGWKGHVGFFVKFTHTGDVLVLGGNQSNAVNEKVYSRERVLGFRTAA